MTFDQIADFVLTPQDVPEPALDMAATLLIDTIGVSAGAARMEAGQIARDHAFAFLNTGNTADSAPMMFDGRDASIVGASFAAATQIDNLDAHDGYNPTKGHIGCAVVPALFAFAQNRPNLSGRDALKTLAMSYEVAARAAITLHATVSDYHTSGAWNALGVVALGGHLVGLDADQLRHAFGIAEYHGPRSQMMREIANPTMLHDGSGMGAMVGAMAVMMAQNGFQGAPAITVEDADVAQHWADLGQTWTVTQNYIKPYPICRWAHASLDALSALKAAHGFKTADVARIDVNTFSQAAALFDGVPQTTSQAQYSLPYALATLLTHGRIGPEHVTGSGLKDPDVITALSLVHVAEAAVHSNRFPLARWSDVSVSLKDGRVLTSGDVHARGGPESPMGLSEVEAKFHAMTERTLSASRRTAIWGLRDGLLQDAPFASLADLVKGAPDA